MLKSTLEPLYLQLPTDILAPPFALHRTDYTLPTVKQAPPPPPFAKIDQSVTHGSSSSSDIDDDNAQLPLTNVKPHCVSNENRDTMHLPTEAIEDYLLTFPL